MRFFWKVGLQQPYSRFGARWGLFSAMHKTQPQEPPISDEHFQCSVFHYPQPYHPFGARGSYSTIKSTRPQEPTTSNGQHFKGSRFRFYDEFISDGRQIHILRDFHNLTPLQTHVVSFHKLAILDAEEKARELFRDVGKALRLVNSKSGHLDSTAIADIVIHDRSIFFHYLKDEGNNGHDIRKLLDIFKCILQILNINFCEGEFGILLSDMERGEITTSHELIMHAMLFTLHHRSQLMFMVRHQMNRTRWGMFRFAGNITSALKWKKMVKSRKNLYACLVESEMRGQSYPEGDEGLILFTRNMWAHWPAFMKIIKAELSFGSLIDSERLLEFFLRQHIPLFFIYLYQFYRTLERNQINIYTVYEGRNGFCDHRDHV